MPRMRARVFFVFFLVSGFCALVYEVIWLRLAMAAFGVTTPLVSIVLSVFMAGLALGSWGGGRLAGSAMGVDQGRRAIRLYALCELLIAISGVVVAPALGLGRAALDNMGGGAQWGSAAHYRAAGKLGSARRWVRRSPLQSGQCVRTKSRKGPTDSAISTSRTSSGPLWGLSCRRSFSSSYSDSRERST